MTAARTQLAIQRFVETDLDRLLDERAAGDPMPALLDTLSSSAPALARPRRASMNVTSIATMPIGEIVSQVCALPRTRSIVAADRNSRTTMAAAIMSNSRDRRSVSASGAPATANIERTTREKAHARRDDTRSRRSIVVIDAGPQE